MFLKRPFFFGKKQLPNNIFYSPLAGCSDFPFRKMSAKYKPGLMYCEMVKMDALIRNDQNTFHILDFSPDMHPIGAQIVGSKPELAGKAAKIIEDLGFDVVDFNCGCPVDKVTKDGSGSGMLKHPKLIGEIIANMVAAVKIPVTVKIRAGWDEDNINAPEITEIAEQAGAQAIAIHARTRKQAYKGPANWEWIKDCKRVAKNIKIIGNGDVTDGPAAERMFRETGCDAVLVSRGTLGRPWIVEDIIRTLTCAEPLKLEGKDYREALLDHFLHTQGYHGNKKVVTDMRRVGCWYIKKGANTRAFRDRISRASTSDEIRNFIAELDYDDESTDDGDACDHQGACSGGLFPGDGL